MGLIFLKPLYTSQYFLNFQADSILLESARKVKTSSKSVNPNLGKVHVIRNSNKQTIEIINHNK